MVREVVTIQVGQCGNQIGWRFWDLVLREHVQQNRAGLFDDAMSSFFRNVDTRHADPLEIPVAGGQHPISALAFNPQGETLAFASKYTRNAMRMAHVGGKHVFSNWPTSATPGLCPATPR